MSPLSYKSNQGHKLKTNFRFSTQNIKLISESNFRS